MIIAVSINKQDLLAELSDTFDRSKYFVIHSLTDNASEILLNPYSTELGGSGIQSAHFLIEHNVDVLITKLIGINPFRFLTSANVKVYQCNESTASEAIEHFNQGKLFEMENLIDNSFFGRKRKRIGKKFNK